MKMKKITVISILIGIVFSASVISISASGLLNISLEKPPVYPTNNYGLTYGSAGQAVSVETEPDLISAVGVDGTEGYVYAKDLQEEMPKTPEEAVAITKALQSLPKNAQGVAIVRIIPLYDVDGKTIIGEFTIVSGSQPLKN